MSSPDSSGAANSVFNAISDAATSTVNAVSDVATGTVNAVSDAATGTVNAVSDAATGTVNAVSDAAAGTATAATGMFNSVANSAKNVPFLNSLIPTNTNRPANRPANANRPPNANRPANANGAANVFENVKNTAAKSSSGGVSYVLYALVGIVILVMILFSFFREQIQFGYYYIESLLNSFFATSMPNAKSDLAELVPHIPDVTMPPEAPQSITPNEETEGNTRSPHGIVERVLSTGASTRNEVFNVSQNKFTYYDAEPLCNALGAELATYEQVKKAWNNGADWCNYGWVKGQMAVYPTQKQTYDKLQMGPADQRGACGTVGINGGYFDNPEFKYGVNCYGNKPSQSSHDEAMLMSQGKAPKTPAALKIDALRAEYINQADSMFVRPFNDSAWLEANA